MLVCQVSASGLSDLETLDLNTSAIFCNIWQNKKLNQFEKCLGKTFPLSQNIFALAAVRILAAAAVI